MLLLSSCWEFKWSEFCPNAPGRWTIILTAVWLHVGDSNSPGQTCNSNQGERTRNEAPGNNACTLSRDWMQLNYIYHKRFDLFLVEARRVWGWRWESSHPGSVLWSWESSVLHSGERADSNSWKWRQRIWLGIHWSYFWVLPVEGGLHKPSLTLFWKGAMIY